MRESIQGEKIILRKYKSDFVEFLFEAAIESRGGEFTRWMPWCHENYSVAETEEFIKMLAENWEIGTGFGFAIFDGETDKYLGDVSLNHPDLAHKYFNLGYWIRTSEQNRGIASEATFLLAKAAFEDLDINRIEILSAAENIASQKTAEKAGAIREGVLRQRLIIGDKIHDAVMFSFIREDFVENGTRTLVRR